MWTWHFHSSPMWNRDSVSAAARGSQRTGLRRAGLDRAVRNQTRLFSPPPSLTLAFLQEYPLGTQKNLLPHPDWIFWPRSCLVHPSEATTSRCGTRSHRRLRQEEPIFCGVRGSDKPALRLLLHQNIWDYKEWAALLQTCCLLKTCLQKGCV